MRTFVMGDVHGTLKAMQQCFERSGFDPAKDRLIQLGDVVDGYPQVRECMDLLISLPNCIQIIGNHDKWFLDWATGHREIAWATQGGQATFDSYVPEAHIKHLKNAHAFFIDEKGRVFVHGGLDPNQTDMQKQSLQTLMWDRRLVQQAMKRDTRGKGPIFDAPEVFVGHTSTTYTCGGDLPRQFCNLWMLDTGAGYEGKLTIMDVETKEYWQSDLVYTLYPNSKQAEMVRFQMLQDSSA